MHPIQFMTTGTAVEQIAARLRYGILSAAEALALPSLTPTERKQLTALLADELAESEADAVEPTFTRGVP